MRTFDRTDRRRAVTLLEVAVVAAVASVIFLLLIRWLLTLAAIDSTTLATAQAARSTGYVDARLSADFASASGCTTYTDAPIRSLSATSLTLYTVGGRPDGGTGMQAVTWNLDTDTSTLTRWATPIADASGCASPASPPSVSARPVMTDRATISSGASRLFTALVDGAAVGDCAVAGGVSTGAACRAGAVTVALSVTAPGPEPGKSVLNRTYTLKGVR